MSLRASKGTAVIVDRLLCDDVDIADYIKCTLPEVKWKTTAMSGGGIAGDVELPLAGLAEAMSMQIDLRSVGAGNAPVLLRPGVRKLELRFNRSVMTPGAELIKAGTKIHLSVLSSALVPGGVQRGATMDGNATFSVLRYRWVEDGQELFLLDQLNEVYRVGGVDYSDTYRI